MEKQYDLCLEVLRRLQKVGVLREVMIIGSWCIYFYRNYFSDIDYTSSIRTRDIDFLVPIPVQKANSYVFKIICQEIEINSSFSSWIQVPPL